MRALAITLALALCACNPNPITMDQAVAIDGDTFDAGGVRYRLRGIDAPELPGHCRPGRECVQGDAFAATVALQRWLDETNWRGESIVWCQSHGRDVYDRVLVQCWAGGININDALMVSGHAQRYERRR